MNTKKEVTIEGLPVVITKKRMKNMYLRIDKTNGTVKVSIPKWNSFVSAENFVVKNIDWVKKTRQEVMEQVKERPVNYSDGETIKLWGKDMKLEFIPSETEKRVSVDKDTITILAPADSDGQYRKGLVDKYFRKELADKIEEFKEECTSIAKVEPRQWRIKDMKTKWGTCNTRDRRIWLSLQLVARPPICLKYVMLHELTHLYVPDHGPQFKAYMDQFIPDWRRIKQILNDNGR